MRLERLEKLGSIREIWPNEARDFTPWLAQEENLALLAETLGFGEDGFELVGVEQSVGPFSADILARDTNSAEGENVLIENQYGSTDHDHIGKLVTYASGLEAHTVIIIAEKIRAEHRAALDWLNDISGDDHRFFAVRLEVYRIGESNPAPKFEVVVSPNDWKKRVIAGAGELTELQSTYVEYWSAFGRLVEESGGPLRPRKPLPQQWTGFGIGRTNFEINASVNATANWIRAELTFYGLDSKAYIGLLRSDRNQIESELGFALNWDVALHRQGAAAKADFEVSDVLVRTRWPEQHSWLLKHCEALHRVFKDRVRMLDVEDWEQADD